MTPLLEEALLLWSGRRFLGTANEEEALALVRKPLHWRSLLERALEEGMGGIVAVALKQAAGAAALEVPMPHLTRALHGIVARNLALFLSLSRLREALRRRGLQAILLKGGALIETVYRGHLALRPLSDLDLLIKARDLPALKEVLEGQGFRPLFPSSTFFVNGRGARFDLHPDLVGAARIRRRALAFRFDEQTLWQKALPLDPCDPTLLVLSLPHQILHLTVHALKHSFSRLIWFVDLGLVLKGVRWEELLDQAQASGTLRPLAYALFGLKRLMGVEVPPEVLTRLPRLNRVEQVFLHGVVNRKLLPPLGEGLVAFSIPDLRGRLGYLVELGFPRRAVLAEVFPSTPSWLLYPRRLLQVMALGLQEGRHVVTLVKRRKRR